MPLRRLTHLALALAAIASGLAFQRLRGGLPFAVADVLGDALWALMIYWGCGVLRPSVHPAVRAAGALVVVSALFPAGICGLVVSFPDDEPGPTP